MSRRFYGLKRDERDLRDYLFRPAPEKAAKLPSAFDLRKNCPEVYDQGNEGSCTSHAGCACRTMLSGDRTLDLSRAFLYYQERVLEGTTQEDAGASIRDICKATKTYGICRSPLMPYVAGDFATPPGAPAVRDALNYRIASYERILDIDGVKQALVSRGQPVVIGMDVYESMESDAVAKSGILPMPKAGEQEVGKHAVLIVGYKDAAKLGFLARFFRSLMRRASLRAAASSGYFLVRNSWGAGWGMDGYFQMPYEYFAKYAFDFWIMK